MPRRAAQYHHADGLRAARRVFGLRKRLAQPPTMASDMALRTSGDSR